MKTLKTQHETLFKDARRMEDLADNSIDLVVTSPPYPMIEMWDLVFEAMAPEVGRCLSKRNGPAAFEAMHKILDPVWEECFRVLKPGGFACINIGDATRTINARFALYTNHARILSAAWNIGFTSLPCIIWRKQTNAPNKFMGSGMLPAGAYVTLEHEYVLILRKKDKREFKTPEEKQLRRESAVFWEERNVWFSDVWFDIKGTVQALADVADRKRSAAFPFALAHRLINMYSVQNDLVLDPFMGTGTTMAAAMAAGRSSMGYDRDPDLVSAVTRTAGALPPLAKEVISRRLDRHLAFVEARKAAGKPIKHRNEPYGFPVITNQEKFLQLYMPAEVVQTGNARFEVSHEKAPVQYHYSLFDK
ncbi:MAG: site-specific DNA-methyltransferase [Desulfotignum sp.]